MAYAPDEETSLEDAGDPQATFYGYLPIMKFGDHDSVTAVRSGFAGYDPPSYSEDLFYRVYLTEEWLLPPYRQVFRALVARDQLGQ